MQQSTPTLSSQPKKLIIKGYKPPRLPENFESSSWELISNGMKEIFEDASTEPAVGYEMIYRTAENMVRCHFARSLYDKVHKEYSDYVDTLTIRYERIAQSKDLRQLLQRWSEYLRQTKVFVSVFMYLDRCYVINKNDLISIEQLSMGLFKSKIIENDKVLPFLVESYLDIVEVSREDYHQINAKFTELFIRTGSFAKFIESHVIAQARDSYRRRTDVILMESGSSGWYFQQVSESLAKEEKLLNDWKMPGTTINRVIHELEDVMIADRLDSLFGHDGALAEILGDESEIACATAKILASLFLRINAVEKLKQVWIRYVKELGSKIVNDVSRDDLMIDDLISLQENLQGLLEKGFSLGSEFSLAMRDAFESFINCRQNKPAELLAKYVDNFMKGTFRKSEDGADVNHEETNIILEKVLSLFRFLQGKDVFGAFFKQDLAKRLLYNRSMSIDLEKQFLLKLKSICGVSYTSHFETMFKDLDLSFELINSFKQWPKYQSIRSKTDFGATIITSGIWPTPVVSELIIPEEINTYQQMLCKYYLSQHKRRVLTWNQGMGNCILKAHFSESSKELQVTISQALVLLAFNDVDQLHITEIKSHTGLDDATLNKVMASLSSGKGNIILSESAGKFIFNNQFTSKNYRIRLSSIIERDAEAHASITQEVFQDRQHQIDAAIVRIMKTSRRMPDLQLYNKVYEELQLPIAPVDIHSRVAALIEREFLARDQDNQEVIVYLT